MPRCRLLKKFPEKQEFSFADIAKELRVAVRTVHNWKARGYIDYYEKPGKGGMVSFVTREEFERIVKTIRKEKKLTEQVRQPLEIFRQSQTEEEKPAQAKRKKPSEKSNLDDKTLLDSQSDEIESRPIRNDCANLDYVPESISHVDTKSQADKILAIEKIRKERLNNEILQGNMLDKRKLIGDLTAIVQIYLLDETKLLIQKWFPPSLDIELYEKRLKDYDYCLKSFLTKVRERVEK